MNDWGGRIFSRAMNELEYKDLLIGVWWDTDPGFFVARSSEEFGRTTLPTKIRLPFDDPLFLKHVDNFQKLSVAELQYVGGRLFDALFQGDILRLYVHLREQMKPSGSGLRLRLRLEPYEVARLPWECLYDTRSHLFLGGTTETTLLRYVDAAMEPPPTSLSGPLRVLVAAHAAEDADADAVRQEAQAVAKTLRELAGERIVEVIEAGLPLDREPLTPTLFAERVRDAHVVHLVGQSVLRGDDAFFGFSDGLGGSELVSAAELRAPLKTTDVTLIVVSSPDGTSRTGPALARELVSGRAQALVAQSGFCAEDVLSRWVDAFYRAVGQIQPLDAALAAARSEVAAHFPLESTWLGSALYTSRRDARSFHSRAGSLGVYQLSEGRYRRKLRETLDRIWPKPERYSPLGLRFLPRPREALTSLVHSSDLLGKAHSATELTRRFQRVLFLGEPGSGKTMTLYRLFYVAAESIFNYSAKSPLPYYLSLADPPPGADLVDYLGDGLDRELFLSDLDEGRFLFLVDGVDGLSAPAAARSMSTLNNFMRTYPLNRFVISSRQPGLLPLNLSTWAEFLPLAESEAVDFLTEGDLMGAGEGRAVFQKLWSHLGPRAGNPQLLAMTRRLLKEGAAVPESFTQAFSEFYRVAGKSLPAEIREDLLPALALFMTRRSVTSVRPSELDDEALVHGKRFSEMLSALRAPGQTDAEGLLNILAKSRLLRGPHAFSFPNLALQEFLTAKALEPLRTQELLDLLPGAEWVLLPTIDERPHNLRHSPFHGAFPFLCGIHEDAETLILELAGRDLLLASRCFRESRKASGVARPLRARVEKDLSSSEALGQRVAALCLEAIGDSWAIGHLEAAASDAGSSARKLALSALGTLHSARSVSVLKAASTDDNPDVAQTARQALARLKVS